MKTGEQIDLYSEIVPAALAGRPQVVFDAAPAVRKWQEDLRGALEHSPLRVYELAEGHFQHFGDDAAISGCDDGD